MIQRTQFRSMLRLTRSVKAMALVTAVCVFPSAMATQAQATVKPAHAAKITHVTVTDPATGKRAVVIVDTKHYSTKSSTSQPKVSKTLALRLQKKTGWGWSWHALRCGGGAAGFWQQFAFLPPWYRGGMAVLGCIVAW